MNLYDKLSDPLAFIIFVSTLALPVLIGIITLKKTKTQSDFFIGGRAMNKFVVALSAVSSGRSAWLVLGISGIAYTRGVSAVWAVVGYIVAEMFQFIYIGQKLRKQTEKLKSLTLLDYFESRFQDKKHLVRITGAVIIAIFITAYVAAQFSAGAKSLSTALDIPLITALIISAVLVLVYMVLGGFIAVAYNDVVRAVIMLIGLVIFPIYGLIKMGGFQALLTTLGQLNPAHVDPFSLGFGLIIGYIGIGLGSPGQPHIIVRYMSIDDPDKLRIAAVIGTTWNVIMAWGAVFIGLMGRVVVPVVDKLPDKDPEMIYLVLSSEYFGSVLYGLLVGGIFAAILSTADSQLLVVASTFARDIYEKIIKKGAVIPEADKLKIGRYAVFFSGIFAVILAYVAKEAIFWLVLFAWGGLGASFGPALIFSLYWKRTNKYGIVAGMITGTLVTIIWKLYLVKLTGLYELIPAFFLSALAIVIVSLLTKTDEARS
ncbi:MAG: sodium/proline symporter [Candidatus Aminicenantes bacterium]|nr:sodium/proline symporter [Candidatus Aminicenantes bacterium]